MDKKACLTAVVVLLFVLGLHHPVVAAEDPLEGDLRNLSVGTKIGDLPKERFINFACGANGGEPTTELSGWQDYSTCPADEGGLHEVAFEYADDNPWAAVNDKWEGTKVAGHPVQPSLLITSDGVVKGIRIVTNGRRMYLKKKAYLLPIRIMGRYGSDGWDCQEAEPSDGKTAIGGMFIDRHCEKIFHGDGRGSLSNRRSRGQGFHRRYQARDL